MPAVEHIYEQTKRIMGFDPEAARIARIEAAEAALTKQEESYAMSMNTAAIPTADVALPVVRPLTAADRCIRCGHAQAYTVAEHVEHGELVFCAHHGREHKDRLIATGWLVTETTVPA